MKIKARVSFWVKSEQLSPGMLETHLGLAPDRVSSRGSRLTHPPRPRFNMWEIQSQAPSRPIEEQLDSVAARVRPHADQVQALIGNQDATAALSIVRYFNDPEGDEELSEISGGLTKLSGQHQLLGWSLSEDLLRFLQSTGAFLDVDEYG